MAEASGCIMIQNITFLKALEQVQRLSKHADAQRLHHLQYTVSSEACRQPCTPAVMSGRRNGYVIAATSSACTHNCHNSASNSATTATMSQSQLPAESCQHLQLPFC
jgi:hypothetical protein